MPEETSVMISIEEAKRRKAVADMIMAEISVSEALSAAEPLSDAEEYPFEGVVWHCQHGWLYTAGQLQAAVEGAEAGGVSKAELNRILAVDKGVDHLPVTTFTTLPGGSYFDDWADARSDKATDADEKAVGVCDDTIAEGAKNTLGAGLVRVELAVNGQTASFTGEADTVIKLMDKIANL